MRNARASFADDLHGEYGQSLRSCCPSGDIQEMTQTFQALFLGFIEGLTEFLPVSSTGHLLLIGHFLGFESTGKTFEVLVQLGAILAILLALFRRALDHREGPALRSGRPPLRHRRPRGVPARRLHRGRCCTASSRTVLFNPWIVCMTLIAGGFVLLIVDALPLKVTETDATKFPLSMYAKIGFVQCLAMVPGVSRSGATIVGGDAAWEPTSARRPNSRSSSPCRPWPAPSRTTFSRTTSPDDRRCDRDRHRLRRRLRVGAVRREDVSRLRLQPWVRALRLVADHRRVCRPRGSLRVRLRSGHRHGPGFRPGGGLVGIAAQIPDRDSASIRACGPCRRSVRAGSASDGHAGGTGPARSAPGAPAFRRVIL